MRDYFVIFKGKSSIFPQKNKDENFDLSIFAYSVYVM